MSKPLVIYHGNCFDGFTAAWVCHRFTKEWHEADFFAARYGDAPPTIDHRDVLIVDFSYRREILESMYRCSSSLRVLDHHKTAQADLEGLDFCLFDMERSGAGLAWDELVGGPRPWLVDAIEDRDLWRFAQPDTREVLAYVATQPHEFANWDRMVNAMGREEVVRAGRYVQDYIDEYGRKACEQSRYEWVGECWMPVINTPYMNCSDHVNMLLEQEETPVAAGYFRRGDGRWQFSLRSKEPYDCSDIAKKFGGGGHAQAAGFDVERLPWE